MIIIRNDKLMKIKDGVYLSKDDPLFFEKYMDQNPILKLAFEENKITEETKKTYEQIEEINKEVHPVKSNSKK